MAKAFPDGSRQKAGWENIYNLKLSDSEDEEDVFTEKSTHTDEETLHKESGMFRIYRECFKRN